MNFYTTFGILFGTLLMVTVPDTVAYSKYGRTCKDIGCRSDETCVMAEDPCTGQMDKCGRYPTCQRTSDVSCVHIICGENEYCKNENGVPKCVKTTGGGYESAGVSYVNGERVTSGNNANPYANANAPPAPPPVNRVNGVYQSSSGSNMYPPYPSNTGSSSANGYPPYPQSNNQAGRHQDLGYPPYPTQNRMPMPGQSYPSYPQYPQTHNYPQYPGYQSNNPYQNYPQQNYPGYPNQNQRGYTSSNSARTRKNAASVGTIGSLIVIGVSELFVLLLMQW